MVARVEREEALVVLGGVGELVGVLLEPGRLEKRRGVIRRRRQLLAQHHSRAWKLGSTLSADGGAAGVAAFTTGDEDGVGDCAHLRVREHGEEAEARGEERERGRGRKRFIPRGGRGPRAQPAGVHA